MKKFQDGDRFRHVDSGQRGHVVRLETCPNSLKEQYVAKWDDFPIVCYYDKNEVEPEWENITNLNKGEFQKLMDEHMEQVAQSVAIPCDHDWKTYNGFMPSTSFEYCTKCDEKKT